VTLVWPQDLEPLETVSQNEAALDLFLRMAQLSRGGRLSRFLVELGQSEDIDPETKAAFAEVAQDADFLHALDEYVRHTRHFH
jgi:hypothetical protein